MSLKLHPFPFFLHPPFGLITSALPVTRDGVRLVPPERLVATEGPAFAELNIRRKIDGEVSRGLCGLLSAAAFNDGTVRPHEKTLHSRLQRQEAVVMADGGALGKPVLLTVPSLKDWWLEMDGVHVPAVPAVEFRGQNNHYLMRSYAPAKGANAQPVALKVPGPLAIADGHHRAETHARLSARGVSACDFIPVCIIGGDELTIGAFTRVITSGMELADLLPQLAKFFHYELLPAMVAPRHEGEWLLVRNNACYRLTRRTSPDGGIDADWLDRTVLPAVFGITDTRTDKHISFSPTPPPEGGYLNLETEPATTYLCGFPLPVASFFAEVAAGRCLPPKSTMFEPRVPSGLVVWRP